MTISKKAVVEGVGLPKLLQAVQSGEQFSVSVAILETRKNDGIGITAVRGVMFKGVLAFTYEGCSKSNPEGSVIPIIRDLHNRQNTQKKTARQVQALVTCKLS